MEMMGLKKFFGPNEHGWLSYGITIQGKLQESLGVSRVAVERVTLNPGVDYAKQSGRQEDQGKSG